MLTEEVVLALVKIGFGALAGGLTNTIAVWMLFHPYEPPRLFGRWQVGFLHGAVPKNQPRLASAIGRTVGNRLLTPEDLTGTFANVEFRDAFDQRLAVFLDEVLHTQRGSLRELIPEAVKKDVDALVVEALQRGLDQLETYIATEEFEEAMRRRASDLVDAIADEPIGGVLTPARGTALEAAVEEWLQNAVESEEFRTAISDYLQRGSAKLLEPGRTFEEILPLGLVGSVEKAIASYLPLAAERLGSLLEDPKARARFESTIHDLLHRFLRDLKFHQRVVARVVMTEDTVDKVLDTIEAEGAERLSEILRDPAVQEAIAKGVNQAIVDFLRRPVNEVLGDVDDPTMIETRETLVGWVTGMARDSATREFDRAHRRHPDHHGPERGGSERGGQGRKATGEPDHGPPDRHTFALATGRRSAPDRGSAGRPHLGLAPDPGARRGRTDRRGAPRRGEGAPLPDSADGGDRASGHGPRAPADRTPRLRPGRHHRRRAGTRGCGGALAVSAKEVVHWGSIEEAGGV
jgi:uncharacterized membrane protein YheB (UPF0754 family)